MVPPAVAPNLTLGRDVSNHRNWPVAESLVSDENYGISDGMDVYSTRLLSPATWDDFARLVEANNGVWGGCWCMAFHAEGVRNSVSTFPRGPISTCTAPSALPRLPRRSTRDLENCALGNQPKPTSIGSRKRFTFDRVLRRWLETAYSHWWPFASRCGDAGIPDRPPGL